MKSVKTHTFRWSFLLLLQLAALGVYAQPSNDDCLRATLINRTDNFCSVNGAFTTADATSGTLAPAACFTGANNDVWFVFNNAAPAVTITITGATSTPGGTLTKPEVEIYRTSDCINFLPVGAGLACASAAGQLNNVQLTWAGLTIGELIYIRVQSGNGGDGTFQLCIDNFFPPADPGSDCVTGAVLCDKSTFSVQSVEGAGQDRNENAGTCLDVIGDSEEQSIWFKWTARTSGNLELDLIPLLVTDDLDFVVYELPSGFEDCSDKIALRCNANFTGGQNPCGGTSTTGMRAGEPNTVAAPGCPGGENGYVSDVNLVAGRSYALVVNNFTQSGSGFRVVWGGSAEFEGPVPDFELTTIGEFECDKRITATDLSFSNVDTIVNYTWNFGAGAVPATATGPGPHDIEYISFGLKSVVLTVESSEGCLISSAQNIDIEACCQDFDDIQIDTIEVGNVTCFGGDDGFIEVTGSGGNPAYSFRLNDDVFLPIRRYEGLSAGTYTVDIVDIKGCPDQIRVVVQQPPQLILQLSDDQTIRLGTNQIINNFYSPGNRPVSIRWTPSETLSCDDCFFPIAEPTMNTTYYATITDSTGCTATDSIVFRVEATRDIYIPNAFTPGNNDALNSFFSVYGGIDVAPNGLVELKVFNRWGGMVYNAENIPFANESNQFGWDGRVDGQMQNTGVYVYMARVRFLDGVEIVYSGDITLIQ